MTLRVLVADDEALARSRLRELLDHATPSCTVQEARDGDAAVRAIRDWNPDIVFLDVRMPGHDGLQVVEAIGARDMPVTVFVTAFDQFAVKAFDAAAVDYLLKPYDDERFHAAYERAVAQRSLRALDREVGRIESLVEALRGRRTLGDEPAAARTVDRVVVKTGGRSIVVPLASVQWMESNGNYVSLHAGREKHDVRETLGRFETTLDPERWVRIHRRVIVAIDAVKEMQPWFGGDQVMILKDGTRLKVSRTHRAAVEDRLAGRS
jgi:two-component system LytT family response regulator